MTINPTVDMSMVTTRLTSGGKNRAQPPTVQAGGGGLNVARGIRALGGSALAVHTRGGETGRYLDRLLDEEGIAHRGVDIDGDTRIAFVVGEEWTGHSYHVVPPGPELTATDERRLLEVIVEEAARCRYLVLTGSATPRLRENFCADIVGSLATTGVRVVLDITAPQLRKVLTEEVFLIRLDRETAATLTGTPIESFDDARAANDYLLEIGATEHAITTVGPLGAVYSSPEAHYELTAPALVHGPRSDACAGDSLVAAVTYRLCAGDSCEQACAFGVAAAAATVALPGTEMFAPSDVETLLTDVHRTRRPRRA
ncbi:1-phosphofructokinase family hexose kinase [Nocardia arizonensis]|uniref:1-phosphofructokinase family hexose kinase n=1 Tax=Nocardia arizonensis TaxID=1141647 RepID=UPI00138F4A8A|nr:PfkB family carbohydrate kinase [Nocardia arizonensis]